MNVSRPDIFICRLLEEQPDEVVTAVHTFRRDLKNPPMPPDKLFDGFERIGLAATVAELRKLGPPITDVFK